MFPARLELATFRVLGGRDNHYTTETVVSAECPGDNFSSNATHPTGVRKVLGSSSSSSPSRIEASNTFLLFHICDKPKQKCFWKGSFSV